MEIVNLVNRKQSISNVENQVLGEGTKFDSHKISGLTISHSPPKQFFLLLRSEQGYYNCNIFFETVQ